MKLFVLLVSFLATVTAYGGAASLQQGSTFSLLGGERISPHGDSSKSSSGLTFDLESQKFQRLADSGVDRAQHSVVEHEGEWFIFGGETGDVQRHNPETGAYETVECNGDQPNARVGHSAVVFKNVMYVLGGRADDNVDSSFLAFDLSTNSWREMPATPFGAIADHSAAIADGLMWVFGGVDARGRARNSLWTFDFATEQWTQSEVSQDSTVAPQARAGHSALVVDQEMLIFGGEAADGTLLNDVWALHLDADSKVAPSFARAAVLDEATAPSPRAHAALAFYDHALWVFGGRGAGTTFLDVWALDLEYLQWELISCFPGVAFPACREAAITTEPAHDSPLSEFRYASPGVSEATYTVRLNSQPRAPVRVVPDIDAGHVQVSPSELTFDATNWATPQTVRVLVLEDLFLPGDSADLLITHETESADALYARSTLAPRSVSIPSICGDGRCLGEENGLNCAIDCRNSGVAPFCGDGICQDETFQSCPSDCAVQGSSSDCPKHRPVRCRTGECASAASHCAVRARSTASTCDSDSTCRGAVLACEASEALCPDGSCAAAVDECASLEPCPAGQRRCFDTSCHESCGADTNRCPPAVRNLNLHDEQCRADPAHDDSEVAIEDASRDHATSTTLHRPADSASRFYLLASTGSQYYGQIALPGGAFDERDGATCPCHDQPKSADLNDPFATATVTVIPDEKLPAGGFGGFKLELPGNGNFSPHVASVWVAHRRTDISNYCLAAWIADSECANGGRWMCVDENLETSSENASCECTVKHTRGVFGRNYGAFAFIVDNCPGLDNPDQADADQNGVGDACEAAMGPASGFKNENKGYIEKVKAKLNVQVGETECPASPYI